MIFVSDVGISRRCLYEILSYLPEHLLFHLWDTVQVSQLLYNSSVSPSVTGDKFETLLFLSNTKASFLIL